MLLEQHGGGVHRLTKLLRARWAEASQMLDSKPASDQDADVTGTRWGAVVT